MIVPGRKTRAATTIAMRPPIKARAALAGAHGGNDPGDPDRQHESHEQRHGDRREEHDQGR